MVPLRLHPEIRSLTMELIPLTQSSEIPPPVMAACQSVGKVVISRGNTSDIGSGTYIGDGIWLTNRHVVRDGGKAFIILKSGEKIDGRVTSMASNVDCAVVETANLDDRIKPVALADNQPKIGDVVYPSGFDQGDLKRHYVWPAKVVEFYNDGHINSIGTTNRTGSISGNSGGPTLTFEGELIAPLWGNAGNQMPNNGRGTTMTCCWFRTRTFLLPWRERVMRSLTQLQQRCPPNQQCPPQYSPQQPSYQIQGQIKPIPATPPLSNLPGFKPVLDVPTPAPNQPCQCQLSDAQIKVITEEVRKLIVVDATFRGPAGPQGERGPQGIAGINGNSANVDYDKIVAEVISKIPMPTIDNNAIADEVVKRLPKIPAPTIDYDAITKLILARIPDQRVVLVDGKTKQIIDDETYKPGEAIVFDVNRLTTIRK